MTEQHPLTDPIIQAITHNIHVYDDCRPLQKDMRAAADWQLEQVIRFLAKEDPVYADYILEAMRPQVVDLPQANSDVCGDEGAKRAFQRIIDENGELMRRLADS